MRKSGWDTLWKEMKIGWDKGNASPALISFLERKSSLVPKGKALVPGCGSGYDVFLFAEHGWHATGIDLSPTAIDFVKKSLSPDMKNVEFESGDFFQYQPKEKYQVIYDYTFFCAIFPELRPQWATKMAEIIEKDGTLITLMFPIGDHTDGPPFAVQESHYHQVLDEFFELIYLEDAVNSHPDRQGREKIGLWKRK